MSPYSGDPEVMFWLTVSSYPACCIFHLLAPLPAHTSSHLRANHLTPTSTQTSVATNALKPRLLSSVASAQQLLCLEVGIWKSPVFIRLEVAISFFLFTESYHSVHMSWLWNLLSLLYWKSLFCSSDDLFSFAFCFDKENEVYQFAMCQPFTYSRHKVMIGHIL